MLSGSDWPGRAPRHCHPPSLAVGSAGVMLKEAPGPLPARTCLRSDPGRFLESCHPCRQGEPLWGVWAPAWGLAWVSPGASAGGVAGG